MSRSVGISDPREIGRIQLSPEVAIVVRTLRLRGEPKGDIRKFVIRDDGEEVPTRMGVMLPLSALPEFRELVAKLIEAAEDPASTE